MKLKIFTDAGARGNPGPAAIGVVIEKTNEILKFSKFIGRATNNQAEYQAVIFALEKAKELKAEEIDLYLDSQLIANQLNRKYKIKNKDLSALFIKTWNLGLNFKRITYTYIPREKNKEADRLVNQALKKVKSKKIKN